MQTLKNYGFFAPLLFRPNWLFSHLAQSPPDLFAPWPIRLMACSPPGSFVHWLIHLLSLDDSPSVE